MHKLGFLILLLCLVGCTPNRSGKYLIYKNGIVKGSVEIKGDSIVLLSGNSVMHRGLVKFTDSQIQIYNYGVCQIVFDYKQVGDTIINESNGNHARWVRVSQ